MGLLNKTKNDNETKVVIKPEYELKSIEIDLDNIAEFVPIETYRKLRQAQVTKLRKGLEKGIHFGSPIILNDNEELKEDYLGWINNYDLETEKDSYKKQAIEIFKEQAKTIKNKKIYRLLDGVHRSLAVYDYLSRTPNSSVVVTCFIYKNLTKEQEWEVFEKHNSGIKQSGDDMIWIRQEEMKILQKMQNNGFPISVTVYSPSKDEHAVHFKRLIGAYLSAKQNKLGGYSANNLGFVQDVKGLTLEDYENMKEFVENFEENFGRITKENEWSFFTPMSAIAVIWWHNREKIGTKKCFEKMRETFNAGDPDAEQVKGLRKIGSSVAVKRSLCYMKKVMDSNYPGTFNLPKTLNEKLKEYWIQEENPFK